MCAEVVLRRLPVLQKCSPAHPVMASPVPPIECEQPLVDAALNRTGVAYRADFRCRLDRASSPPPALKLVAAAVAEAREALSNLVNSTDGAEDSRTGATDSVHGPSGSGDATGRRGPDPTKYQFAVISRMLSAIVRNCDFLLKNPRLPVVSLTRLVFKRHLM